MARASRQLLAVKGRSRRRRCRAFTLVEVLATITVIAAFGSVASVIVMSGLDSYINAATQAQLHSELSIAVDRMDRELRRIGPKGGGSPDIASVSASSITWNTNSSLSRSGSQILYVESGGPAAVLLDDVTAFSVQTYNESNTALGATLSGAACDPIRRIMVTVTMQRAGISQTLRTKLFVRSTMEGGS